MGVPPPSMALPIVSNQLKESFRPFLLAFNPVDDRYMHDGVARPDWDERRR